MPLRNDLAEAGELVCPSLDIVTDFETVMRAISDSTRLGRPFLRNHLSGKRLEAMRAGMAVKATAEARPALADPKEVRLHLVAAAEAGVPLTYSELLERLGYQFSRPKMRQLCAVLGEVDREAEARGEPELAVLVVRQSDGLPGQGWWVSGGARERGYQGPWEGQQAARFIRSVQAETFAYWQSRSGTERHRMAD